MSEKSAVRCISWGLTICGAFAAVQGLATTPAWAQAAETPAPETSAPPPGAPPAAPATPPPVAPPPPPPSAVAAETKPPTATESMPATRPEVLPPIDVGAWVRTSALFQGAKDQSKINDWHMGSAYVELHAGGKIHKNVGVTLNLNADAANWGTSGGQVTARIMDAIISFDFIDEFHLWAGHLLVPVDRSNSSGPFFMIPWNYPGNFAGPPFGAGPAEGFYGRNNGAVLWGDIAGGKFSYFAGAFDNGNVATSPLYSGKLRLALWDPEPGFWGNGSYFGDKDILSVDVGGQVQKNGTTMGDKNYAEVNADVLMEKKIPGGGWVTLDGAYYHFNQDSGSISDSFYVLGAYATPTVGVGNIQPMVRFQWEKVKDAMGDKPWSIDGAVSYLIKGPALRVVATYTHTKLGTFQTPGAPSSTNAIQLSAQAIFF